MANIKYADLLDEVLPNLAADPSDPVTENAIRRSVIEFCSGSRIWKHICDPIDVVSGEYEYDLEPQPGSDVVTVLSVMLDGQPLEHCEVAALNQRIPRWQFEAGQPRAFTQTDNRSILIAPVPQSSQRAGLNVTLALAPSRSATGFPLWIAGQYQSVITEGAVAKLMMMPERPWSDIANGRDRRAYFDAGIANARADAAHGLGSAPIRTTPCY